MLSRIKSQRRNRKIVQLYISKHELTATDLGIKFGLSRQRIGVILKKYRAMRFCENCYHFQEYKHCSCRAKSDVVKHINKCTDWQPAENVRCVE